MRPTRRTFPIVLLALAAVLPASLPATSPPEGAQAEGEAGTPSSDRRVGDTYYQRGSWWGALQHYEHALRKEGPDPVLFYRLGRAAHHLRRPEESRTWFEKAAEAYRERTASGEAALEDWYLLASIYAHLEAAEQRRVAAQQALEAIAPVEEGDWTASDWARISRLYSYAGETEEAEEAVRRAVEAYRAAEEIEGDDLLYGEIMLARARQAMAAGDEERAADLYREIVDARPQTSGALYELGLALLRSGEHREALRAWSRARSRDPSHSTEAGYGYHLLGRLLDHAEAWEDSEALAVESRFASMGRAGLESEIARAFGELRTAMQQLQESQGGASPLEEGAPIQSNVHQMAVDQAEADLAAALLAYHLRGLPVREVASQYRLLGWIFARR